jgi:hypothetical protein
MDGSAERRGMRLLALAVGLGCALSAWHPIHDTDPFWHLMLGRAVLAEGSRHVPDPAAFPDWSEPVVVAEWLWEVACYGLYQAGGWGALTLFTCAVAGLAGLALVRMLRAQARAAPLAAVALVAVVSAVLVSARLRMRPQTAFLAILPVFVLLAQAYARAPAAGRLRLAAGLLGLELFWAQLHGSFVLGPALFAIAAGAAWLRDRSSRAGLTHAGVLALLLAAGLTSAHGLGTVHYVLAHGAGDAALHIEDLHPPTWGSFDPTAHPFAAAYLVLWALALAGALVARRFDLERWGFALLGVALLATANRFFAAGGVLLAPLAMQGAAALAAAFPRPRAWLPAACAAALALVPWAGQVIGARNGPFGAIGPAPGAQPQAAARLLAGAPAGTRVLSSFMAGAPLGFWLEGRVRTYVDARTPLHFDAADFAVSRDVWLHADALERALLRYRVEAVVVERERPGCANLAASARAGFEPVLTEASYTTFLPRGRQPALRAVAACGPELLGPDACRDGGAALDADVAQLAALGGESPFVSQLRAERALRCAGDAEAAARLLPDAHEAGGFELARARLAGRIRLARGDAAGALELLGPLARTGDAEALDLLGPALAGGPLRAELRAIVADAVASASDHAQPDLRANLAWLCMRDEDAACVRFHGLRAAARGAERAAEPLRWLAARHASPAVRADAERWLGVLAASGAGAPAGEHAALRRPEQATPEE